MEEKPPARLSPPRAQRRAAPPRRRHVPRTTVLVVDDEESMREVMGEALGLEGYRVVTAASVEEAEAAKQQLGADEIQLVISDVHLTPGPQARAGYALALHWRAQHPGLPFLLVSGDPSNQELPEVRAGALRFLLKPFRIEVFLETVRDALGR